MRVPGRCRTLGPRLLRNQERFGPRGSRRRVSDGSVAFQDHWLMSAAAEEPAVPEPKITDVGAFV